MPTRAATPRTAAPMIAPIIILILSGSCGPPSDTCAIAHIADELFDHHPCRLQQRECDEARRRRFVPAGPRRLGSFRSRRQGTLYEGLDGSRRTSFVSDEGTARSRSRPWVTRTPASGAEQRGRRCCKLFFRRPAPWIYRAFDDDRAIGARRSSDALSGTPDRNLRPGRQIARATLSSSRSRFCRARRAVPWQA